MNAPVDTKQIYLQAARAYDKEAPGKSVWIKELRERAAASFEAKGFPTARDEAWKYTNLAPALRQPFRIVDSVSFVQENLRAFLPAGLNGFRMVFVNGRFRPELSSVPQFNGKAIGGSLTEQLTKGSDVLQAQLGRIAPIDSHALAAMNTAFLTDGAFLHLPAGAVLDQPIHLIYVGTADALTQPHTFIFAGAGSRATIIEQFAGAEGARYFANAVTEVSLESKAALEHYRLQQESTQAFHVGGIYVRQEADSEFVSHSIDFGGLIVRNDLQSVLGAPGASCTLNGLYIVDGRQHVDNHTLIDHAKPRGTSREFYKGVLDGRARAVFNGRVIVQPNAQKTDAEQMNNNLLLSDDAEVDTKPELEIYADDVKCSHGATVGQLDLDELFYLRSRGIDDSAARDLLTFAFANEIIHRFQLAPLRSLLEQNITTRLLHGRGIRERELI